MGVMYKKMSGVKNAARIIDRAPRRLELSQLQLRGSRFGGKDWEFHLGPMELEMCVRYLSQEVIDCSWI